jgi:chemotaxis response regulator CheB
MCAMTSDAGRGTRRARRRRYVGYRTKWVLRQAYFYCFPVSDASQMTKQIETLNQAGAPAKDFPIVCVGGSAGGLDAYIRLLQNLPPDMGVAIVIVNHMRSMPTQLHEILPRYTSMPVDLITEDLSIQPNRVFIIPENRDLHVDNGEFSLKPISKPRGWPDVITVFLRSMTRCWDGKLVAVIVSGYDGDGAEALCGIKQVGGITIAQKPSTARQPDMPESAIASGCIDFVLSPEEIATQLVRIAHQETIPAPGVAATGAAVSASHALQTAGGPVLS